MCTHTPTHTQAHTHIQVLYANRNRICSTLIQFGSSFYRTRRTAEPKSIRRWHTPTAAPHTHTHIPVTLTHTHTGSHKPSQFSTNEFQMQKPLDAFHALSLSRGFSHTWHLMHTALWRRIRRVFTFIFFMLPPSPYPLSIFPAFSFIFLLVAHRWPNSFPDFFFFFCRL